MFKPLISIVLAITILISCDKELKNPEDDLTKSIDGWEITKSSYDSSYCISDGTDLHHSENS